MDAEEQKLQKQAESLWDNLGESKRKQMAVEPVQRPDETAAASSSACAEEAAARSTACAKEAAAGPSSSSCAEESSARSNAGAKPVQRRQQGQATALVQRRLAQEGHQPR